MKPLKKPPSKRGLFLNNGFTLIELLVVVAIIAILAAIAIPQFGKYRVNAAKRACFSDVKSAITMCAAALSENISKITCSPNVDFPSTTTNVSNISITISSSNNVGYIIKATGTCKGLSSNNTVECVDSSGFLTCQLK